MPSSPLIPLSSLIITRERQRQEFDAQALEDLRTSIETNGLLHAPVIRFSESGEPVLVSGESRIRVIRDIWDLGGSFRYNSETIPQGQIPYTTLGNLSRLEAEEAELAENLHRKDLSWQDHAAAVARLARLREEQNQQKPDVEQAAPADMVRAVAKEVYGAETVSKEPDALVTKTRREILVASHLGNPAIAKAKSADEAYKILLRQEEKQRNIELARIVGASFSVESHQLFNQNCIEWMKNADRDQFDVILTDPPYGMGADEFGDAGGKMSGISHEYDDSYESWRSLLSQWAPLSFAVAKPEAHAYVFCDIDRFHELKAMMAGAGWDVFRTPFIIHKLNSGRVPRPEHGPRRQWECLLYAIKGGKRVTHIYPDVIASPADENLTHGAQKPVAVYRDLLLRSVRPGDRVLDSFAGTGPIFPAAHGFKCQAVGIEQSPASYAICVKRLEELKALETAGAFLAGEGK